MLRLLLLTLLGALSLGSATTYGVLSLDDMLGRSQIAFYGRVLQIETVSQDGEPWTEVSFEILEGLKGTGEANDLSLRFYGGTSDDGRTVTVSLMPQFNLDENVLILAYDGDYYSPIVGFRQGLWRETALGFESETGDLLSLLDGDLSLTGSGADRSELLSRLAESLNP